MTTIHQRSPLLRGLGYVVAFGIAFKLLGCVAFAQDFAVTFQHPTNSAPIKAYELYATDSTNGLYGVTWCNSSTNRILFKSWELRANPCKLMIRSVGETTNSVFSQSINFDTRDFIRTNPVTVLPNPVLPPTFLLIEKL